MSPIRGLTHQTTSFPEIGQLRKGGPKPNKNTPGPDLDYFRFTGDEDAVQRFREIYGEQPRMINVLLPFRSVDENWTAWQEEWIASGLVHRCDGEYVSRMRDNGGYTDPSPGTVKCPYVTGEKQRTQKNPGCKPSAMLRVVIPELERMAYVTLSTTSVWDIANLDAQLRGIFAETGEKQDLRGIPLQLRRRPKKVSTPGPEDERIRREMWLLSIEVQPDWFRLQLASRKAMALPGSTEILQLPETLIAVDAETGEVLNLDDDIEEGEFTETEKEEPKDPNRPLAAEAVRSLVRYRAGWTNKQTKRVPGAESSDDQKSYVDSLLSQAIKPTEGVQSQKDRDNIKSAVLDYIIGVTDVEDLISKEAGAILDWLTHPDKDNKGLSPWARKEVAAVHTAWLKTQGQQELPL